MYYHTLSDALKEEFGCKVYKLSLSAGCTCPNRDATLDSRGCIFCSQGGSGDFSTDSKLPLDRQIEEAKNLLAKKVTNCKYIAYFQSFSNTYGDVGRLEQLYREAIHHPDIVALSIATRPDCLPPQILDLLHELNQIKPVWVELGLQTIHPASSEFIRRGFDLDCFRQAVFKLQSLGIKVIVHLIFGLPGETKEQMIASVDYLARLPIDGVKLQLLHVLKNTDLADLYYQGQVPVMEMEEYIERLGEAVEHLPTPIVIHRLTGDGPKSLLIAPLWSSNKRLVLNTLRKRFVEKDICQGRLLKDTHPSSRS